MFRFAPAQIGQMRAALELRVQLLRALLPWDDFNYGLDESWARLEPYAATTRPQQPVTLRAVVFNHSAREGEFAIHPRVPEGWGLAIVEPSRVKVPPLQEGVLEFAVTPGQGTPTGLHAISADVSAPPGEFPEWIEALVRVE
jgi:hypothetical protein